MWGIFLVVVIVGVEGVILLNFCLFLYEFFFFLDLN